MASILTYEYSQLSYDDGKVKHFYWLEVVQDPDKESVEDALQRTLKDCVNQNDSK